MHRVTVAALGTLLCLIGCDNDVFGLDWKRLGGGYSLVKIDDECALISPHESGGPLVVEVGWQNALILA